MLKTVSRGLKNEPVVRESPPWGWVLAVVESPYSAETPEQVERNVEFARRVVRHLADRGYAPLASHLLYTQMLDDDIPSERAAGIEMGLAWARHAEVAFFALRVGDKFASRGMRLALERHLSEGREVRFLRFSEDGHTYLREETSQEFTLQ